MLNLVGLLCTRFLVSLTRVIIAVYQRIGMGKAVQHFCVRALASCYIVVVQYNLVGLLCTMHLQFLNFFFMVWRPCRLYTGIFKNGMNTCIITIAFSQLLNQTFAMLHCKRPLTGLPLQ